MGIYDRNYYRDDQGGSFLSMNNGVRGRSVVLILIGINVAVFLLDAFTSRSAAGSTIGQLCSFLALYDTDATQPWYWFRILTAAFSHANIQHIFGNMIVLFFFGRPIEALYGSKKFLWMFLTAAISANLVWLLIEQSNARPSSVLGASGATAAVFVLFCIHFPHQKIFLLFFPFFGIPAWIMGVILIGNDVLGQLGIGKDTGVNVAFVVHLAGAAYAYLFYRTRWSLDQLLPHGAGSGLASVMKPSPKLKVHRPEPSRDDRLERQADAILQKLHEHGEASLTAKERNILEEYSRSIKQRK